MEVARTDDGVRRERHGVESSRVPRMAAAEALHRQPAALEDAEAHHRLEGVVRTGRIEAATRPQQRAHGPLVDADQECDEGAHRAATSFHSASRLACSALPGAPLARGRALTTRSTAGISNWCRRNDSRMMRRIRLRATPPPATRTATASPRRGAEKVLLFTVTLKNPSPRRRPWAYVASKSRLRRRRRCAGRVSRPGIVPSDLTKIVGSPDCAASEKRACDLKTLGYQLTPALGAAPREDLAAVLRGHARTEPVGALAAHFARLIGTLHTGRLRRSIRRDKKGRQG